VLNRAIAELRRADAASAERLSELVRTSETAEAEAFGGRPNDRAIRAWADAMSFAANEIARCRRERAELEERAIVGLATARREVALADGRANGAGSSRHDARAAQAARLQLGVAEAMIAGGDPTGALEAAESAIALADAAQAGWRRQQERLADPELCAHWARQVDDTLAESARRGRTVVIIDKSERKLHVYRAGRHHAVFDAELGTAGLAPKRHAGDRATPEGRYHVVTVKTGGATRYYKALLLDYPNAVDRRRFELERAAGSLPPGVGPGSLIEIHGHGGQRRDWTEGCVALEDGDMDRLLDVVEIGTPVTIVGRMECSVER